MRAYAILHTHLPHLTFTSHNSSPFPCFLTHDRYGVMAYPMMTSLWIVGPMYYGCYSCRDRQLLFHFLQYLHLNY